MLIKIISYVYYFKNRIIKEIIYKKTTTNTRYLR